MIFDVKTLEFNRITKMIESFCHTQSTIDLVKNMKIENDINIVKYNLNLTNEMSLLITKFGQMPFINDFDIYDILNSITKITHLSIKDILYVKLFIKMTSDNYFFFRQFAKEKEKVVNLDALFSNIKLLNNLFDYINSKMDYDGYIFDDATSTLKDIRSKLKQKYLQKNKISESVIKKYQQYLVESKFVLRNNRLTLAVKDSYKNKIMGIIHDVSQTSQTIYIEPNELIVYTQEIEMLERLENNEIIVILTNLTKEIRKYQEDLFNNLDINVNLDFIHAKALLAKELDAYMPNVNNDQILELHLARHPLIDGKKVVPISLKLDSNNHSMFITGPNTGGKTVALKTIGLLTIMTQTGLLIPASELSNINIYDNIFADIGDEQSIDQNLSTFSSHMTKIINFTEKVSDNSLILLDELGSGTDPDQGIVLAKSIIDYLLKYKVNLVLTTHYAELKTYAYQKEGVIVSSVAFDEKSLKPLYNLQIGISGSSHALKIAQRLGLNNEIIAHATELYKSSENDLSKILEKLNYERTEVLKEQENLVIKQKELDKLIKNYEVKILKHEKEKDQLTKKIIEKIEEDNAKKISEINAILEFLKERKSIDIPQYATIKQKISTKIQPEDTITLDTINVGDEVYIKSFEQYGNVTKIKNDRYFVKFGQFETEFNKIDLRKEKSTEVPKKSLRKVSSTSKTVVPTPSITSFEIDLRGLRYEEVDYILDQRIDQAVLARLKQVTIIHGYGTGAVKDAVTNFLRKNKHIESFRFGTHEEGFYGVTIAYLK